MPIRLSLGADVTVTPGGFAQALLSALLMGYNVGQGDVTTLNAKADESGM
jgi:hypothetical protein